MVCGSNIDNFTLGIDYVLGGGSLATLEATAQAQPIHIPDGKGLLSSRSRRVLYWPIGLWSWTSAEG